MKKAIVLVLALALAMGLAVSARAEEPVEDVVQAEGWWSSLPRESWSQYEKVEVPEKWFEVYKLPGDVYALYEPGQFQEVISFLILGEEKAMLWDTGMGIGNIKACVEALTDLPVFVLNSHSHMDHVGGNHLFDEVMIYNLPASIEKLTAGNPHDAVKDQLEGDSVWMELPEGFDPETYQTIGKAPTATVSEGDIIDLGGRKLEVVHTPGHSADSIMLIDEANGILFTGDTYYPAPLYAFSKDSDFAEYERSMEKIVDKIAPLGLERIYASHNELVAGVEVLGDVVGAMRQISSGEKTDYVKDESGLRLYTFESGVRIITLDNL